MIPASLSAYNIYSGGSFAVDFDFEFPIDKENDLIVMTIFGDDKSILTNGEDYTISGQTVTLSAPLLENQKLVLLSARKVQQQYDFYSSGKFDPQRYEDALDYTVSLIKQNERDIERSLKMPYGVDNVDVDMPLPSPSKLIKWNKEADKLENSTVDADELESIAKRLHESIDNIDTVADNIDNVNTVAENIDIVNVVSSDIKNVSIVADNINSVNICAENIDAIIAAPDEAIAAAKSADEAKTAAENIQDSLETISQNKENIEKNTSDIAKNTANISKNTKTITANSEKISNLEEKITANENNITAIKTDIAEIKVDVDYLKTDVSELQTDLNEVSANVDENSNKIAENKNLITSVQTDVTKIKTDTMPHIEADLTTAKNDILTNANNISELQTDLSEVSENISDIKILKNRTNCSEIYHANALGLSLAEYLKKLKGYSFDDNKFEKKDVHSYSTYGEVELGAGYDNYVKTVDNFNLSGAGTWEIVIPKLRIWDSFLKNGWNVLSGSEDGNSIEVTLYENYIHYGVWSAVSSSEENCLFSENIPVDLERHRYYEITIGYDGSGYYLKLFTPKLTLITNLGGLEYETNYEEIDYGELYRNTLSDKITYNPQLYFNKKTAVTSNRMAMYLNSCSVTIDGEEVFSGYKTGVDYLGVWGELQKIPYVQLESGAKIVDAKYRDRVQKVYSINHNNYYYTLDEEEETVDEITSEANGIGGGTLACTPFAINQANCSEYSAYMDFLDYEWTEDGVVKQINFKIGGEYLPLIATNANGKTLKIEETPSPLNPADYYWEDCENADSDDIMYLDETGLHVEKNCWFSVENSFDNVTDAINSGHTQIFLYTGVQPIKAYLIKKGRMSEFMGVPLFSFRVGKNGDEDNYVFLSVNDSILEIIGNNYYNYNTNVIPYGYVNPVNNTVLNIDTNDFQCGSIPVDLSKAVYYWEHKAKFNIEVRTSMTEELNVYLSSPAYSEYEYNEEREPIRQLIGRTVNGVLMTSFDADVAESRITLDFETDSGETVHVDKVKLTMINTQQMRYRGNAFVWNEENEPIYTDGSISYTIRLEDSLFHVACYSTLDELTEDDVLADAGTLTIDWGDGTIEEFSGEDWKTTQHHYYSDAGTYSVKITNSGDSVYLNHDFRGCSELIRVPETVFAGKEIEYAADTFRRCTSLEEIPQNIFSEKYADNIQSFSGCFYGCESLKTIPENLFPCVRKKEYRNNNYSFYQCFYGCNNIVLNENIFGTDKSKFKDLDSVNFRNCFEIDSSLRKETEKGTAPDLWNWELPENTEFDGCFAGHSAETLTNYDDIPNDWK